MRLVCEAGSYLRLIESCITQLEAQGPSRTCTESEEKKQRKVVEVEGSTLHEFGTGGRRGVREKVALDELGGRAR